MTETNKERRVRVANEIRVLASPQRMPRDQFDTIYVKRQILTGDPAHIERTTQEMYCTECQTTGAHGSIEANLLHVTIEDDPLRNFWKLASMRCFGCGFHEHVPLMTPDFAADPDATIPGSILGAHSHTISPLNPLNPPQGLLTEPWATEYCRQQAEKENKRQQQINAAKQAQMQQQLAQFQKARQANQALQGMQQQMNEAYREIMQQSPPSSLGQAEQSLFKRIFG